MDKDLPENCFWLPRDQVWKFLNVGPLTVTQAVEDLTFEGDAKGHFCLAKCRYYIQFQSGSDAMLFKLAFLGG